MKIKHLKNQLKCFTLQSGKSFYLYPFADNVEISEQDFFLTPKLQAYVKSENAVMLIQEDSSSAQEIAPEFVEEVRKVRKQKKSAKEIKE